MPNMPVVPVQPANPNPPAVVPPAVPPPGGGNVNRPPVVQDVSGAPRPWAASPGVVRVVLVLAAGLAGLVVLIVGALVVWGVVASQNVQRPRRRSRRDEDENEDDDLPPPRRRPRAAPVADAAPLPRSGIRTRPSSN